MKIQNLKKIITMGLIAVTILTIFPMSASAEWKEDNSGWWYTEANSCVTGWKDIYGEWYYFDSNGYMKTGWIQDGSKWYYLYSNGAMAKNATINGYTLDSNGAWIQPTQNNSSNVDKQNSSSDVDYEAKKISDVTGVNSDDITKIIFADGRGGLNKPVTVEDKQKVKEFLGYLDGYIIKKSKYVEPKTGWIHYAQFYINEKEVMSIYFVDPMIINGNYYDIVQGDLGTVKIGKFFKSIDPSYDIMAGLI